MLVPGEYRNIYICPFPKHRSPPVTLTQGAVIDLGDNKGIDIAYGSCWNIGRKWVAATKKVKQERLLKAGGEQKNKIKYWELPPGAMHHGPLRSPAYVNYIL